MLSGAKAVDFYFSLALFLNSSRLERYYTDDDIQSLVDVIVWEDRVEQLLRVCDFYHTDLFAANDDDQYSMGAALGKYIGSASNMFVFDFNTGSGKLYFIGTREEVFAKVRNLS